MFKLLHHLHEIYWDSKSETKKELKEKMLDKGPKWNLYRTSQNTIKSKQKGLRQQYALVTQQTVKT